MIFGFIIEHVLCDTGEFTMRKNIVLEIMTCIHKLASNSSQCLLLNCH